MKLSLTLLLICSYYPLRAKIYKRCETEGVRVKIVGDAKAYSAVMNCGDDKPKVVSCSSLGGSLALSGPDGSGGKIARLGKRIGLPKEKMSDFIKGCKVCKYDFKEKTVEFDDKNIFSIILLSLKSNKYLNEVNIEDASNKLLGFDYFKNNDESNADFLRKFRKPNFHWKKVYKRFQRVIKNNYNLFAKVGEFRQRKQEILEDKKVRDAQYKLLRKTPTVSRQIDKISSDLLGTAVKKRLTLSQGSASNESEFFAMVSSIAEKKLEPIQLQVQDYESYRDEYDEEIRKAEGIKMIAQDLKSRYDNFFIDLKSAFSLTVDDCEQVDYDDELGEIQDTVTEYKRDTRGTRVPMGVLK